MKIKPHGQGTVIFPEHSAKVSYEGEWQNGQMHGLGKHIWADGSLYEGQYVRGKKEGEGKFTFASKNYYEGFWLNGKQDGVGLLRDRQGVELKRGRWSEGTFKDPISEEEWAAERAECEKRHQTSQ